MLLLAISTKNSLLLYCRFHEKNDWTDKSHKFLQKGPKAVKCASITLRRVRDLGIGKLPRLEIKMAVLGLNGHSICRSKKESGKEASTEVLKIHFMAKF